MVVENEGLTVLVPNISGGYDPHLVSSTTHCPLLDLPSGRFPRDDPVKICMHPLSSHPGHYIYLHNSHFCIIYTVHLNEKFLKILNMYLILTLDEILTDA
jgi:hypothetical protein